MGGKHLKRLRAEKSKVKLKKSKSLSKGQNITDTSFKVKKIVTVEQLKKVDENEPVSNWNVPLKDLLVHLGHYNYTSRLNGLTGIRELIKNYPDALKGPSLRPTITRVLELLTDVEHKIRVTAINLLSSMFSQLPPNSIASFYDIFNVHLGCAMTHRDVSIQRDSLKFIDVMIEHAPEAVKKNFQTLIKNFIRILTSYKFGSHSEIFLSKGSKQDLEKSRSQMLLRFYQVLAIAYSIPDKQEKSDSQTVSVRSSQLGFSLRGLKDQYKKIPELSLFKTSVSQENGLVGFGPAEFQTQASSIMSLVLETWAEFTPNRQIDGFVAEHVLSGSIAELLLVLLKILLLLHEKTVAMKDPELESWFISTYGPSFKKSFMSNFPYVPSVSPKKSELILNGENGSINSSAYMVQNLIICYLYYCFKIKCKNNEQEGRLERYVSSALLTKNTTGHAEILSKVLEAMINSPKSKKSDFIITTVVKGYNSTANSELRRKLFKILIDISLEDKFTTIQGNQAVSKWLKTLPDRLQKPRISVYVVEAILKIINRPIGSEVLKEIENKITEIIVNLPYVRMEGIDLFEGQKLISHILYSCRNEVLEEVIKKGILQRSSYPEDLRSYIVDIFSYKLTGQSSSC